MRSLARVLLLLAAVSLPGCDAIQERVLRRAVESRLQAGDRAAWLDDGSLHVVLCGTGSPLPAPDRSGPCTAILAGGHFVVVDAGGGAAEELNRLRLPLGDVDELMLTHFHSDHIADLGELGMQTWALGRSRPLSVTGPPGVARIVIGFESAYRFDTVYRAEHHGSDLMDPAVRPLLPRGIDIPAEEDSALAFEKDGLRVTAFRVDHAPVKPAYGYRFDYGGRSVVVSGDTAQSPVLERVAQGADLLVHEALADHMVGVIEEVAREKGMDRVARIMGDIPEYHTTPIQAAESAQRAGVRMLAYTHVVPPPPNAIARRIFLRGTAAAFDGEIVLGEDGMHFRLPAESSVIESEQLD